MVPFVHQTPRNAVNLPLQQRQTPRFGSAASLATVGFRILENNPLAELVFKDITCFNLPKMATTRTKQELLDVATLELSNTSVTVGSSLVLPPLLQWASSAVSGVPSELLKGDIPLAKLTPAVKMARLGTAFGFLMPFAAAFWGAAFFRNWMTLRRNKTADFEAIIGLKGEHTRHGKHKDRSLEEEMLYQKGMAKKILGAGVALGALSLVGFGLASRGMKSSVLPKAAENLYKTFHLGGPAGNQINGFWPTLIFWLSPAYLGWMHASRGKNELREQMIKAGNSVLWFSVFNRTMVDPFFKNRFNSMVKSVGRDIPTYNETAKLFTAPLRGQITKLKNTKNLIGMLISIGMLSVTPQLLNIALTKHLNRGKFDKTEPQEPVVVAAPPPQEKQPTYHTLQRTLTDHFNEREVLQSQRQAEAEKAANAQANAIAFKALNEVNRVPMLNNPWMNVAVQMSAPYVPGQSSYSPMMTRWTMSVTPSPAMMTSYPLSVMPSSPMMMAYARPTDIESKSPYYYR